ncbi:DEAD/DEAH box helicase [Parasediminibacterium sp. JCM 36343]|uniref:DEAD/DEAH box helicase n=1 Tax=Parasediminibacterium sp. JCM 36343 TaxID=3374279 RepID=UPI00397A8009
METIEKQTEYFKVLIIDRQENARVIEKSSMEGVKGSVVEKYSDQAHFIYELLQNANDVKATKAEFRLTNAGLYFSHNGTIHFTITNPENEREDKLDNRLGHINSITSIGQSNKTTESTIGKFGVGFKAVFQYTDTPHIYDTYFQFKIERFIVPQLLENDLEGRNNNTVFYFPFDKKEMPADKAFNDIIGKLKSLSYPTLFLSYLNEINWKSENESGNYTKHISKSEQWNDISYSKVKLNHQIGLKPTTEKLLLFSRNIENSSLNYSIGFFLDRNGQLQSKQLPAFCFFPTEEVTNLNFILNAPFLLTDSRAGIKRYEVHNTEMVELLAQLVADSLLILKDLKLITDDIINIIPYKESKSLFAPFYSSIKNQLKTQELLPAKGNTYAQKENAYWAEYSPITNVFSNEQLSNLTKRENAKWVFESIGRNEAKYKGNPDLGKYIEELVSNYLDIEYILRNYITNEFIQNQTFDWVQQFYEYLSRSNDYMKIVKTKPIFIDSKGNAVPAFEQNGKDLHPILFLPSEYSDSPYIHIHPKLLENEKSKEFIEQFGIKQPSLKDEIYNNILPQYKKNGEIDIETHFQKFFKYYKDECPQNEISSFIELIKDKEFVIYKTKKEDKPFPGQANEIYYPYPDLLKYFESKPDTKFLDLDGYYNFINETDREHLKTFLFKIGVNNTPIIYQIDLGYEYETKARFGLTQINISQKYYDKQKVYDKFIDGSAELIQGINKQKSLLLWKMLSNLISKYVNNSFTNLVRGIFEYVPHWQQYKTSNSFDSSEYIRLTTSKWLIKRNGDFSAPHEITVADLSVEYEKESNQAKQLIDLLKFKPLVVLTEEQEKLKFLEENNIDLVELRKFKEWKEQQNTPRINSGGINTNSNTENNNSEQTEASKLDRTIKDLDSLQKEYAPKVKITQAENSEPETSPKINFDEDEEFAKGIEDLKEQLEIKKSRVDLAEKINTSKKYSYDWFVAYLQLLTTYGEKQDTTKQKSISFQEIKSYKTDNKYFLLCGASSYISPEIENADDFKVSLVFGNGKKENIIVEGVSKKGQDLLIYCRESLSSNILSRLSNVFKVEINFTPVIDLLDRLYKAFTNANYIDEWEFIKEAMPPLNYIYGPPGTGKTTTLCNNINSTIKENPNAKILVLTPTNKASDVVCKKLIEINSDILAVRLSRPTDPELEEVGIYRDTIDENDMKSINVVASTIHRLPYFDIKNVGLLFQYQWDYVIFDESSMTGLHYITFALMAFFKSNPYTKFIIAGDPKQIPPVIEINDKELENFDFQDESIYKMMKLESFKPEEQLIRDIDTIKNLETQYRSVPKIGQLFSELSYSGLLKHDRESNRKETKPLPEGIKSLISSNVTFIDIPVNQDNSIYRVNKLLYSSYQTYCAIMVTEIVKYFDTENKVGNWTIGLIAPYKAQAIILNKLITSYGISDKIKVYSDTVHGFQGDECDIVFFVCNPNNYYYTGHEKSLLSKEYIYNVAISRAKDYLVILHPYTTIRNNKFINEIGLSFKNNFGNSRILNSREVEKVLFNDENYIENNSYVSGHDNVNVFGLSEMKYFIKSNDTAIDIQLRDLKENKE